MVMGVHPRDVARAYVVRSAVTAICLLAVAAAVAFPARAAPTAYPPLPPKPPRAKCAISTIVNRRVSIICNAGRLRARHRAAIRIGKTIVARGVVPKTGLYVARFRLKSRLTRGTLIRFLVDGKIVATVRA
jgi:hypothetical protein